MSVKISFTASEVLYEPGGALYESKQPDSLELGPFDFVQLTYEGIRVGPDGDHIGFFKDGLWALGVETIPLGQSWSKFGPAPNALLFSDVGIYSEDDD